MPPVNLIVGGIMALLVVWILYMAYSANPPPPPPPPPPLPPPPPPPSATVNVATFIDPTVNLDGSSGTEAKLTVLAGRSTGYVPSTNLADHGDGTVVNISGPTALPLTQAMSLEELAAMVQSLYERLNPNETLLYETGAVVDNDSVDLRFRYYIDGDFHHVDAQRYTFTRQGSQVSYVGSDGKNSGLYVLPLRILDQFSPKELWPVVQAYYINLVGTNAMYVRSQGVDGYTADYEFVDPVNGTQKRRYVFGRTSAGSIEVTGQGDVNSATF